MVEDVKDNIQNDFSDIEIAQAREFIQGSEGFKACAYKPTPNDVWTIGYGHTGLVDGKPITKGMVITKEKAEELYRNDFKAHIAPIKKVKVSLTGNQKIALASLIYNIGGGAFDNSTLLKKLNNGDYKGASDEFDKWVYQNGKKLKGLVNRRKREKELFLTPDNY